MVSKMSYTALKKDIQKRISALEAASGCERGESSGSQGPAQAVEEEPAPEAEQEAAADGGQVAIAVEPVLQEGAAPGPLKRRIVICGHSMVFWAAHQARRTPIGSQLGLSAVATVEWLGRRGLRWPALLPLLFRGRKGPPPHILVLHLGGNDLGLVQGKALSLQATVDLREISRRWPGVLIFWSEMLQRRVWREASDPRAIEGARRKANRAMKKPLGEGLGIYLPHPRIKAEFAHLYRDDGVHLSPEGNEIFLDDLRQGLRLALSHLWGVRA
ncbi:uncharacterized protein LOC129339666 [Eublepharis macularius]|uniref:Uncharacterized protein LOC129339666 n=1 Tax=Eublepharis macularius TaxID=481883 RepID=A0AA97K7Z1_EUBMA|nr:uncharacterized protein LOC129339666 [Eublepharis macularius]